jgi:hypothetical protein
MACVTSGAETPTYSSMNTSEESWTAKPTTSAAGSAGSILPTRSISPTPAWARVLHGERRREVAAVSPQPGREVHGLTGDEQLLQPGPDEALGDEWVPAGGCRPGRGRAARCGPAAVPEPATAVSPRRSLPQQARAASESGRDPADHVAWAIAHAVVSEGDLGTVKWEPSPPAAVPVGGALCARLRMHGRTWRGGRTVVIMRTYATRPAKRLANVRPSDLIFRRDRLAPSELEPPSSSFVQMP